jgi:CheY-like chemotaxis protein
MGISRALKKLRMANPFHRARDGKEALDMLRSHKIKSPHIILLDLNMPRMNGLEMLDELRKDEEFSDSVVFVLTTSKDDNDVVAAYNKHIAGYIVKSNLDTDFTELLQLLDHYWRIVELPVKK